MPALEQVETELGEAVLVSVGGDGTFHNVLNATIGQLGAAQG
jgi:diacylglycerol kinase family enzyme